MTGTDNRRIDRASRLILASPETLYDACLDADQLVHWLPPEGMTATVHALEAVVGGALRLSLFYTSAVGTGKTSDSEDALEGRYIELVPGRKIVYDVEFESDDPAYTGTMTQTWTFDALPGGTRVTIACVNVPPGISSEDHASGMDSTLANLAAFAERPADDGLDQS